MRNEIRKNIGFTKKNSLNLADKIITIIFAKKIERKFLHKESNTLANRHQVGGSGSQY